MWRLIALLVFISATESIHAETIRVTTWNLQWFPSGSANGASPEVEMQRIAGAAKVLSVLNPDVMLLQEVRDFETCKKLADALRPLKYEVLVCSAFRDGFSGVVGRQQVAILAKTAAEAAWFASWKSAGAVDPPRGYVFALLRFGKKDVAFYSLHLKSNLVRGDDEREVQLNILKRELAAEQVVEHTKTIPKDFPQLQATIIGGDFNTNRDQALFVSERTLATLEGAGFASALSKLSLSERITCPGKGKYLDATFDYLFGKGLRPAGPVEVLRTDISDHYPVTMEYRLEE